MRDTRKFSRVIGIVVTLVIVAGVTTYLCRSKEPGYQGMTLTEWLKKYSDATLAAWGNQPVKPSQEDCQEAIRSMGTNVIPFLLKHQTFTDNRFKARARTWLERHPSIRFRMTYPEEWRAMAMLGFGALGTNGAAATPALIQLAKSNDYMERQCALMSLECVHPRKKFIRVLIQLFEDTANPQRAEMGLALSTRDVETAERVGVFKAFPQIPRGPKQEPDSYWMRD